MLEILRRRRLKKPRKRRERLDALARENRRAIRDMIRRRLALPPERRTHFLRSRTRFRGSSL
jgi:hypothetical protein